MTENVGIKEAADYLGCSVAALRTWKRQGRGPKYFRLGKLLRYRRTDLDEWILDQLSIATMTPTTTPTKNGENPQPEFEPQGHTPHSSHEPILSPLSRPDSRLALLRRRRAQEQ